MADSFELFNKYMLTTISETVTANGSSGAFISRNFSGLSSTINITALTGTKPAISFSLEESDDGDIWHPAYNPINFTATGNQKITGTRISSLYFRFSWTITGTSPSATFKIVSTLKSQPSVDAPLFRTQSDTFTTAGNGIIASTFGAPLANFTLSVTATGLITSWNIVLEGSTDGITFSTIAKHTELIGSGFSVFPGTNLAPCLYFRTRCLSISLGLGTSITTTVLGSR